MLTGSRIRTCLSIVVLEKFGAASDIGFYHDIVRFLRPAKVKMSMQLS